LKPTRQHRIDQLEGLVDFLADFGAREYNLAADENQENNLRLHHTIDETREQLGFVGAEVVMLAGQPLQTDGEFDVAGSNNVLDLEVGKLGIKAKLLDDAGVLAASKLAVILGLCACHDHFARGKDQGRGLRIADTHDDGGKALNHVSTNASNAQTT
jgi:hypothetical protein